MRNASGVVTRRARQSAWAQARHRYAAERNAEKGLFYAKTDPSTNTPLKDDG